MATADSLPRDQWFAYPLQAVDTFGAARVDNEPIQPPDGGRALRMKFDRDPAEPGGVARYATGGSGDADTVSGKPSVEYRILHLQ